MNDMILSTLSTHVLDFALDFPTDVRLPPNNTL